MIANYLNFIFAELLRFVLYEKFVLEYFATQSKIYQFAYFYFY